MLTDQLNHRLVIATPPQRVISLVPSLTELLVDLGLEDRLVGVTKFCVHPSHLRKTKTIVGGTKNVHQTKIENLNPDFILCNKEENTQNIVLECQSMAPTYVSDIYEIKDVIQLISDLGQIFNVRGKSEKLVKQLVDKAERFQKDCLRYPTLVVAYCIWRGPWMVAANQTFIHHLLLLCNFENAFEDEVRYPEIDLKEIPKHTDCIFLSSEPFPFREKHIKEVNTLLPDKKAIIVDGEYFSWYGSRLLKAMDYFKKLRAELNRKFVI